MNEQINSRLDNGLALREEGSPCVVARMKQNGY